MITCKHQAQKECLHQPNWWREMQQRVLWSAMDMVSQGGSLSAVADGLGQGILQL